MALPDDFLDMPLDQLVDRLAIGAEGEDDLAGQFRAVGWPVCQLGRAAKGAKHPPLMVGHRRIKLPDMMVKTPALGWVFVEARVKRNGTIPGTDCYGMNTSKNGCIDRWRELLSVEEYAENAVLAIFDPRHGWQVATVSKLSAIGLRQTRGGEYWLIPRDYLTPLSALLDGTPMQGLVLDGRAV